MSSSSHDITVPTSYFAVDIETFDSSFAGLDLYLKHDSTSRPTLYCAHGAVLSEADRRRLLAQGVTTMLAPMTQHARFRHLVIEAVREKYESAVDPEDRARNVRAISLDIVREAIEPKQCPEAALTVLDLGRQLAAWVQDDEEQFLYFLDMSRHDFDTATHMLDVGLGCGALMRHVAPHDIGSITLALQGGMLHDIGKRTLDKSLLHKQGALTGAEWEAVRKHPLVGHQELKRSGLVPAPVLEMVRDHHERLDGGGYPRGVTAESIGRFARICSIVDVFDAITSARSYRRPMHPLDALGIMEEGVGAHFDADLFEVWKGIVHRSLSIARPDTLPDRTTEQGVSLNLSKLLQWGPGGMTPPAPVARRRQARFWDDERRTRTRKAWRNHIPTKILECNHLGEHTEGDEIMLRSEDISVSGIQLTTPYAFAQGDLLRLQLPGRNGTHIVRFGRVVRVRKKGSGEWVAGIEFFAGDDGFDESEEEPRGEAA